MARLSIGMPVYNGERYIREALDSILAQTYTDFELIISDNASTDKTELICREYASKDSRIRYYRNEKNIGANLNFNRVFLLSSGEYFKWAAYDDLLSPDFLTSCIHALDEDPSIVLCHSKTALIDEHGEFIGTYQYPIRIGSTKLTERFGELVNETAGICVLLYGVVRSDSIRKTQIFGNWMGSDKNLLLELGLIGRISLIPKWLFFRRSHPQAYTEMFFGKKSIEGSKCYSQAERNVFPVVKMSIEYFRSIKRLGLTLSTRMSCYGKIVKWFLREGWFLLLFDAAVNLFGGNMVLNHFNPIVSIFKKMKNSLRMNQKLF